MKVSKAVEGFTFSKLADGMSPNTIRGYKTHFDQLIEFVQDIDIEKVSQDQLQRFMHYLRNEYTPHRFSGDTCPYKTTTLRNAWCAIRSLFGWAHKELGFDRPDLELKKPQVSYPDIQPFTKDELQRILKAAVHASEVRRDNQKGFRRRNYLADRNKALVLLLLDTGIRASECAGLKVKDVNFQNGEIFVRPLRAASKNKSRTLRIGSATTKALWVFLNQREHEYPDDPLFLTRDNRAMDRNSIGSVIKRIGKTADVRNCFTHRFRHTFAIQFIRNGGDVFSLQHSLGHTDWTMTRHYANLAQGDLNAAHRRASPVDNWRL